VPAEVGRVLRRGGHLVLAPSQRPRFFAAARERLLQRRLKRQGFVPVHAAEAGNGNFFVARLDGRGASPHSD
jgi:predicted methyltransferase